MKVCIVKAIAFPVVMHEFESWTIKKAECQRTDAFWTVVLKNTLESLLYCKETKAVTPIGNQPWIFIGRTDAEAPTIWPHDVKSQLTGKDPDAWKDWGQEEKREAEDKMVGWHHQLNGHEFEQTPGDGERQGRLVCYSPWGSQRVGHDWTITITTESTQMLIFNRQRCTLSYIITMEIYTKWTDIIA